jgi:hypothetical protein
MVGCRAIKVERSMEVCGERWMIVYAFDRVVEELNLVVSLYQCQYQNWTQTSTGPLRP